MVADTTQGGWTKNFSKVVGGGDVSKGLVHLSLDDMMEANLNWGSFALDVEYDSSRRVVFEPRPHQREAIDGNGYASTATSWNPHTAVTTPARRAA